MKNFEFFVKIFVAIFAATGILTLNSCQEDEAAQARVAKMSVDTTEVFIGYAHESTLTHRLDTARRTSVKDEMEALLKVWQTEDGEKAHLMYNNSVNPVFNAKSLLRYEEYSITEDQLDAKVIATWLARSSKDNTEIDTLYVDFADGQRDSIPMDITSFETEVGGHPYYHGTVTVVDAKFVSLTNYPIETRATRAGVRRAPYVAKSVNTEYKAMITLKEKNVHGDGISPKTFDVPVYAYAIRHIMKDDAIKSVTVENKNRVVLTDSTERCSFDKVTTFESGDVTRESIQIELKREFKGIDTYEKAVSNFDFSFNRSKGIAKGTDAAVREDGKWLVSGRTDRYAATITNGVAADMITTDYSLYHERAVYTDGDFVVEFGYEDVRCNELETTVNKIESNEAGKSKALEHNKIQTVYIGHPQDLAEDVILVMTSKLVTGYEIANPLLKVYNDSVVATLDFITKFSDGTKDTEHERFSAPRSLVCTTDWSSTQIAATQTTDETVSITTTSSNDKKQGYWKFTEQTRRLDNYAHLSDDSKQHNSWTAVVPNSISYTREGKTHDFGVLAFAATHVKATLVSTGKTSGGESYKYTEEIKVRYQDNNQNITAPGKLLVNGSEIRGYEIRDKKLVVDNDKVTASLTFVTVFMNGTEDKDPVSKTFPRSLKLNTNWTAIETATANQTTGQPTVTKTGSQSKTDNEWKWNEETRSITTVATLASSKQNNNWTSVDPNNIVFTRNGQIVDFGTLSFNAVYVNATTVLKNKTGLVETYDYANTISVNFGDNMQTTTAPGTIRIDREKEVIDHEIRDAKMVISENSVDCSLTFVTLWNDGTETTEPIVKSFPRTLNPYTNWTANATTNSENTGAAVIEDLVKKNMTDGNWSYVREERDIITKVTLANSVQENGWTSVEPNSIVYTRDGKTHAFGEINFNAKEDGHSAVLGNSSATLDVYNYTDKLTVTYGSDTKSSTAPGIINVKKEIVVVGYEIINQKLDVQQNGVTASLDFITKFSDGSTNSEKISKFFARRFEVVTNWNSDEANNSQKTGAAVVSLNNSEKKVDGDWSYVNETRSINTEATLAGSHQNNGWQSVDPNNIVFTKNGQTYSFVPLSFNATETGANVSQTSEDMLRVIYAYKDNISVSFGGNTFASSAPGTIRVTKPVVVVGYEIVNKKLTVSQNSVTASLDFITKFSDGSENRDFFTKTFPRSLNVITDWTAVETTTANQTTGYPTVAKTGSQSKTDNEWSWNEETRSISSIASLASSQQNNGWNSVDPNNIVFTKNGQTADFGTISFNAVYVNATTALKNKTGLVETYSYANTISVNFGDNTQTTTAPGTIRIERAKEVTGHEIRDAKMVISDNDVTCSLTFVTLWNDGTETTEAVNKSFPRTFNPYTNWTANANNGNEQTGAAVIEDLFKKNMTEGNWSYVREERDIITKVTLSGSTKENGWTSVEPNSIVYTREGKTHAFGEINFNAKEDGHSAVLGNSSATLDVYNYTDKLTVTFGSNTKSSTAPGTINVKKEIVPVGYEIVNQKLDVQQNGVTASLDFVTKFSDGTSTSEKISKFFARRFEVITNWNSVETSNSQSTGAATVTLNNSENKVDGDWSYVNETRSINTIATLAGSTQNNGWTSVDPNAITFTKNGKTYSFQTLSFNASETGANVSKTSEDDDATVYAYKDNISVTFGGNQFASSAPGKITVNKPWDSDFPKEWGKFVACKFTVAPDENRKTWVYTWSMHFEHGTLPVVVRKSASEAEINQSYFTSETDSRLNGGYYLKSKKAWVNTIADDGTDWMEWLNTANQNQGNMAYSTATAWGWDNGAQTGGHPSVFTNRFTAKITNGGLVLTIYKEGKEFASYKAGK